MSCDNPGGVLTIMFSMYLIVIEPSSSAMFPTYFLLSNRLVTSPTRLPKIRRGLYEVPPSARICPVCPLLAPSLRSTAMYVPHNSSTASSI